ncbi:MAG: histidine kinase N-terminal 7TM domain-containing protein [Patescibacteria group bacterium]|nr:histidine kinase N-terminal 7TM domain-containing protein [Patescibacteria group bacterium]
MDFSFDITSIITLIILLLNFLLCFYVFYESKGKKESIIFGFLVFVIGFWIFSTYLVDRAINENIALSLSKIVFIGPIIIPAILLHFSLVFPFYKNEITKKKLLFIYIVPLLLLVLLYTNLIVKDVDIQEWGTNFIYGSFYLFFIIYFLLFIIYAFIEAIIKYKNSSGLHRMQMKYVFLGILISAVIAILTNIILPIFNIQEFSYIGIQSIIFFVVFTSYAIVRHRLMDIRLVVKRTAIYASTIIIIILLALGLYWLEMTYFKEIIPPGVWGPIVLLLGLILFESLKNYLERIANKYFFASIYNYQATLEKLAQKLTHSIDLDQIIDFHCQNY